MTMIQNHENHGVVTVALARLLRDLRAGDAGAFAALDVELGRRPTTTEVADVAGASARWVGVTPDDAGALRDVIALARLHAAPLSPGERDAVTRAAAMLAEATGMPLPPAAPRTARASVK